MPKNEKRLGRGLNSLISPTIPEKPKPAKSDHAEKSPQSEEAAETRTSDNIAINIAVGCDPTSETPARPAVLATEPPSSTDQQPKREDVPLQTQVPADADYVDPQKRGDLQKRETRVLHIDPESDPIVSGAVTLPTDQLVPHRQQPRQTFDAESIAGLAASLVRSGIVQPLVVRPVKAGPDVPEQDRQYEIIAGERRWRAAKAAGLSEVPVVVRDLPDEEALELALVENIQREDLNAIDRARAYRRYCDAFEVSPEALATRLGEDRTTVVNYLRLLGLPEQVKTWVAGGQISMGHARALLGIDSDTVRTDLARAVIAGSMSVRALEDRVRRLKAQGGGAAEPSSGSSQPAKAVHVTDLENRLQQVVGTKVTIREGRRKGTGRLTIEYYSLDDFDRIAGLLGLRQE